MRPTRPARHRAFAAGGVAILAASLRLVGCSSSGCALDGFCCCDGDRPTAVVCGVTGATCASGATLLRGTECAATCASGGDAQSDAAADAAADVMVDACGAAASDVCCCQSYVTDPPSCSDSGALSCRAGYGLYHGDDCRCLPDRDTPCCPPHVHADAASDADAAD
jgi:hypothetical protein